MKLQLQIACAASEQIPDCHQVESWAIAALRKIERSDAELTIRVVDQTEMAELNHRYRGKLEPTNVLSFSFEAAPELPIDILGDVVLCAPVVATQAAAYGKPLFAHWAHLVVHGTLHLCGFDHQQPAEAKRMEILEVDIMNRLGIAHPYWVS